MKPRRLLALCALLLAAPMMAHAQTSTNPTDATRRELAQERRDAMRARRDARAAMTPEQRKTARSERQARIAAMPPEQQQYLRDLRTYQQALRSRAHELQAQVDAGTMTRDAMARELKSYRDANRPARPSGMPEVKRTP